MWRWDLSVKAPQITKITKKPLIVVTVVSAFAAEPLRRDLAVARAESDAGGGGPERLPSGPGRRHLFPLAASSFSISSITAFIFFSVSCSGSLVVMSTPASRSRSIGYFEPPAERKVR